MRHSRVCRFGFGALILLCVALVSACGSSSVNAGCAGNVAVVNGTSISTLQYKSLLTYTLGFYEKGNPQSRYYGKKICGTSSLARNCTAIKQSLLQRMIDQQVVSDYAAGHGLIATASDWAKALGRERKFIHHLGGHAAFTAYLSNLGIDEAEFRFLESQQIETNKVIHAVGSGKFHAWLASTEKGEPIVRCPLPSVVL